MNLAAQTTPLIAALEQLGPHDHFCSIYESPQEHYAVAIPFIRIGLDRGEKCIYIADDGALGDVRQAMQSEGIDVDRAIGTKALVLATKDQTYLEHGTFHPDWMFTFWKETTELAMSEGFSALRATGETEWVLRGGRGLERWMEYESRLTNTLSESNCSALCQYNRRLFPPDVILDVIRTHPTIVYGGTVCRNLYYVPPEEFLGANQTAREVERLLTNIRERERVDNALREQLTERRRVEEELRAQARLLDLTHDSVFSRGMDDKITYWNHGAEELYGWTREEALGKVCHQLTQTIFPAPLAGINAELLRTGRWEGELVHTKRDGTQLVVSSRWSLLRDELSRSAAILETNNDITESKQAEEALRRSERYLAEAQRLSHTGSWAFSANSKIAAYWSEEDFRIWGFDPQQGLPDRERVFKRIHPEDFRRVYEKSMKALREKTDYTDEFRIVLPDGEVRHIHALAHPVLSASGEIAEYVGTHVDITERKRAEEAQLRLASIVASSDDAIISKTLDGIITTWNAGAQRIFGYAAEEAVGRPITMLIPPDRHGEEAQIIERLRRGESVHHFETVRLRKDGREIHVSLAISPIKDAAGQIIGASKIARDITERKRAEAELRESEEQWRDVFENNPTMYFMVDAAGTVLSVNPFGAEQLGYTVNELVGQPVLSVFPDTDREAVQRNVSSCLEQLGQAKSWEARKVRKDGASILVRETAKAVPRVNGPIVLIACENITEQRRAAEALRQAEADLAHVSRVTTMGQLTASLAHEVNQPITAAVTNANTCVRWLAGDTPNIEEARDAAMRSAKDGTRAAEIISRIRLLFKKGITERELVDVNEVIREMIVLLRSEATRYSVSIRTDLVSDLSQLMADRVQVQQVLMNLMLNGIDAMKEADGARELTVKSRRGADEQLVLSVSDTGVGLPREQVDQIFDAFFTTKLHGTGLGLSISRSIVESHGGRLWADANSPGGASFHLALPTKFEAS
jgi:PAS domain S-box-containing protein